MTLARVNAILGVRHPDYLRDQGDWDLWRDTFEGGTYYRDRYLEKFPTRESDADFTMRKKLTPIPTFAKAAIIDIRNSLQQRTVDVTRIGGSSTYQEAVNGERGGVDGEGSTMDSFIGKDVLTELLVMGKVGVYVDAATQSGTTLADPTFPPYLSFYQAEDILSYDYAPRGLGGEFSMVYLRDHNVSVRHEVDGISGLSLPSGSETQFRLVWKDTNGDVWFKLLDEQGNTKFHPDSGPDGAVLTGLSRVPFVLMDIDESLLKDVSSYQLALLNLISNDVYYGIQANSPFLTIQKDSYGTGDHLRKAEGNTSTGHAVTAGAGKGYYYGPNMDRPGFISPSVEPLSVSMTLQNKMEDAIRTLVNLAVSNKQGTRTESAESKKVGTQGLENGLAFIGMVLEAGEKLIAQYWAEYEDTINPNPAVVSYPDRYVLKSDSERIEEASDLVDLVQKLPGHELKKATSKQIVVALYGGKIQKADLQKMLREIDNGDYLIATQEDVRLNHEAGLVDDMTASEQLGYDAESVVPQARKDRAARIEQTLAAQTPAGEGNQNDPPGAKNPASRGAPELDTNPQSGKDEKSESKEPTV